MTKKIKDIPQSEFVWRLGMAAKAYRNERGTRMRDADPGRAAENFGLPVAAPIIAAIMYCGITPLRDVDTAFELLVQSLRAWEAYQDLVAKQKA